MRFLLNLFSDELVKFLFTLTLQRSKFSISGNKQGISYTFYETFLITSMKKSPKWKISFGNSPG